MLILLEYNQIKLTFAQKELVNLGLDVAKGEMQQEDIVTWIKSHKNIC